MESRRIIFIVFLCLFMVKGTVKTIDFNIEKEINYDKNVEISKVDCTNIKLTKEKLADTYFGKEIKRVDAIKLGLIKGVFALNKEMISELKKVNKKRFASKYLNRYNKFDDAIQKSLIKLEENGENPNYSLIKAIMLVETGMIPRKNHLGYHGFPQTKWKYIKSINEKFNTNFTLNDMYTPEKSAEYIHYYLKDLSPISYVNNVEDYLASYNWGVGNYKKYLNGEREMPDETKEYISLIKTMLDCANNQYV